MDINMLYGLVQSYIEELIKKDGIEELTHEKVEEALEEFMYMPNVRKMDVKEIEEVKNKIRANNSVTMNIGSCIQTKEYKYKKWYNNRKADLDMEYWERYRKYLLKDKKFPHKVIDTIDRVTDELTELLGDPIVDEKFQRRGLIIGDVQSGKTSNYTGLMCKGADVGYKVIIVLTGTIEKLRKQTQMRIDEGFIGMDSDSYVNKIEYSKIGAGNYGTKDISPVVLTSKGADFKSSTAKSVGFQLNSFSNSVVFVVKKNVSSLKNLNKWLKSFNKSEVEGINQSLLLIDDEADNASVNTNNEEKDPTAINAQIRVLLNSFKRASYVGFTATPFANIFIDPDTVDDMEAENLFPSDYIYSLNPPSNYIGARNIFDKDGSHSNMLRNIVDIEGYLPMAHKNGFVMKELPESLEKAVRTFFLANTIRDLRGQAKEHRSMLINISRFNQVQKNILELVDSYVKNIQYSVKAYSKLGKQALEEIEIKKLKETFVDEYSECEFEWEIVQENLSKAILSITTLVVNQKSKIGLDYDEYEDGLRVIAIGGLSLSRGLTLEGLMVSYFYRNSKMYDTLMQMGRWFGYRGGYDDLCRLWMGKESREWYEYISMATDELREDIKVYQNSSLTPKEFGIRVRSDKTSLLVTARNKMRSADTIKRQLNFSADIVETVCFDVEDVRKGKSKDEVFNFVKILQNKGVEFNKNTEKSTIIIAKDINCSEVEGFLENIEISILNQMLNMKIVKEFIKNNKENGLELWDIAFIGGESEKTVKIDRFEIPCGKRKDAKKDNEEIIRLANSRLGSTQHGKIGLDKKEAIKIEHAVKEKKGKKEKISQKEYFKIKRKPLLCIYFIDIDDYDKTAGEPVLGFSIGIPEIEYDKVKYVTYTINRIQQKLGLENFDDFLEEE